jgi:predicted ester cyclase
MTARESKDLVVRMIHEVWNEHDASAIDRYDAPALRGGVHEHHAELMAAFSDVRVDIEDIIAEGDMVAARLTVSGRHDRGHFAGQPPSGRRLVWSSFRFFRVAEGQIVETWAMQDRLGLMEQLGSVAPSSARVHWADGETR